MPPWEQFTTSVHPPVDTTVDDVLTRMRALDTTLPSQDGLAVTWEIDRRIDTGRLTEARAAATLDVRFAERYLTAVDAVTADRRPPACWRPLFQMRHHPGVRPLQFALAGSTRTSAGPRAGRRGRLS